MPQHAAASGGNGPGTLVFCHANGFPAGTYRQLFDAWRATGWRVEALDKFGHDPAYPVTSNWPRLRDQLVGFIERVSPGEPVRLVGHSLGGYLALLAACKRPALVHGLVLIVSPIVTGWRAPSSSRASCSSWTSPTKVWRRPSSTT